jgi:hypothetical protein
VTSRKTARWIGLLAAVTQLALAVALVGISTAARDANSSAGPPEPISRGLALGLLFSVPAAIGGIGAIGRRPALLFAAGIMALAGSVVSFSGVTLMFLIPAILFVYAAAKTTGPPRLVSEAALTILLVVLGLGAAFAPFGLTDARCWVAEGTSSGTVYRITPFSGGSVSLSGSEISGGCDTGLISLRGAALATVLGIGVIGLAGWSVRPRRRG